MANTVKFIQDTDLGSSLQVKSDKVEVGKDVVVANRVTGVMESETVISYAAIKQSGDVFPELRQNCTARPPTTKQGIQFEELRDHIQAALVADPTLNRIGMQEGPNAYTVWRNPSDPSDFVMNHAQTVGVQAAIYPYIRVVQSDTAPLFVKRKPGTTAYEPYDPAMMPGMYNLIEEGYLVLEVGRTATLEFVVPLRLRSVEMPTDTAANGLIYPPLFAEATYADGTTESGLVQGYSTGYFFTNVINQTKAVKQMKITVTSAVASLGAVSMTQIDFATGKVYGFGEAGFGSYTPVLRTLYLSALATPLVKERFWRPATDITSHYTVTTNITAAAGTSVAALTDNNDTTVYQASTAAASLSLTLTRATDAPLRPQYVRLTFLPDTGTELGLSTLQTIVISSANVQGSGSTGGSTRWFRNPPATAGTPLVVELVCGRVNIVNELSSRIAVTLTKTDTTKPFRLSSVQVFGTADY